MFGRQLSLQPKSALLKHHHHHHQDNYFCNNCSLSRADCNWCLASLRCHMQSRDFHQIRHCPHKKIEMESISSRFNNDVVCVALISSWNGIASNRINLQFNNFITLVQFRGGVGADCPMYTENPIFEPSPQGLSHYCSLSDSELGVDWLVFLCTLCQYMG